MTLKEMLYHNDGKRKIVSFQECSGGSLWYETEDAFRFPVPLADVEGAVFKATDFAPVFMKYIRKHMALIEEGKSEGLSNG